jgi:addiction module HigA family antidote
MPKQAGDTKDYEEGDLLPLITPGQILLHEFIEPYNLTRNSLAKHLDVSATAVSEIVEGQRSISPVMAIRLGLCFNTTPQFWSNLQQQFDIESAQRENLEELKKKVTRVKEPSAGPALSQRHR